MKPLQAADRWVNRKVFQGGRQGRGKKRTKLNETRMKHTHNANKKAHIVHPVIGGSTVHHDQLLGKPGFLIEVVDEGEKAGDDFFASFQ